MEITDKACRVLLTRTTSVCPFGGVAAAAHVVAAHHSRRPGETRRLLPWPGRQWRWSHVRADCFRGIDGVVRWRALVAFLSLLPAIGASLVWVPVTLRFLMVGAIRKCEILVAFCGGLVGLVCNLRAHCWSARMQRCPTGSC